MDGQNVCIQRTQNKKTTIKKERKKEKGNDIYIERSGYE